MVEGYTVCMIQGDGKVKEITAIEDRNLLVADGHLYFVDQGYWLMPDQKVGNVSNPFAIFAPGHWGAVFKYYREGELDVQEEDFDVAVEPAPAADGEYTFSGSRVVDS